jgi:hypothetical protein
MMVWSEMTFTNGGEDYEAINGWRRMGEEPAV